MQAWRDGQRQARTVHATRVYHTTHLSLAMLPLSALTYRSPLSTTFASTSGYPATLAVDPILQRTRSLVVTSSPSPLGPTASDHEVVMKGN